jgi:hypothetical protein
MVMMFRVVMVMMVMRWLFWTDSEVQCQCGRLSVMVPPFFFGHLASPKHI